jgi:hypothetical protein
MRAMMKGPSSCKASKWSKPNPAIESASATHPTTFLVIIDVSAAAS